MLRGLDGHYHLWLLYFRQAIHCSKMLTVGFSRTSAPKEMHTLQRGAQEGQRQQLQQQQHQHNRCNAAAPACQHVHLKPLMSTHPVKLTAHPTICRFVMNIPEAE